MFVTTTFLFFGWRSPGRLGAASVLTIVSNVVTSTLRVV
jgi:hypothetical protein